MTDKLKLKKGQVVIERSKEQVKLDKVAETYVKIRDARTALKRQFEADDQKLKDQQETLDSFLLQTLRDLGVESVKTAHGTVYQSVNVKASCQDWNSFYTWIAKNKAFDALEKRVKKSFVVDYMADNKGALPPGVTVLQEYTVVVRRGS